VIGN
jgi:hypothetical protein